MKFMVELMMAGWCVGYSMAGVVGMEEMMMDRNLEIRFPGYLAAKAMLPQIQARAEVNKRASDIPISTQSLAGIAASPVTQTGDSTRPFAVGNDTFTTFETAVTRSCNNQHNDCAAAANAKTDAGLTVGQCDTQQTACLSSNKNAVVNTADGSTTTSSATTSTTAAAQPTLQSSDADFFYFCDA